MEWKWSGWPPSRREIDEFLQTCSPLYLAVLSSVRAAANCFAENTEGRKVIYRVFSRTDYQPGRRELKTVDSILGTLLRIEEKEGRKKWPHEMGDIVGLRIICIFPRDVDRVVKFFAQHPDLKPGDAEKKDEPSGYRATHIPVGLANPTPDLRNVTCEVQIATMLNEAWSFKTHDPVYKGREVAPEHKEHVKLLSDALYTIDHQSQLLQDQILEKQMGDEAFKLSYIKEVSRAVADPSTVDPAQFKTTEQHDSLVKVWTEVLQRAATIPNGEIHDLLDMMDEYVLKYGADRSICRIMLHIAVHREYRDCDNLAIQYANRLIKDSGDSAVSYRFKAVVYFFSGDTERALEQLNEGLPKAKEQNNAEEQAQFAASIAYTLANRHIRRRGDKEAALEHLCLARNFLGDDPELKDTQGFVEIVFGDTIEAVEKGYALCTEACSARPDRQAVLAYHRHVAYSRLARLSQQLTKK